MTTTRTTTNTTFDAPTAEQWFAGGERVPYDPRAKRVLSAATPTSLSVFRRLAGTPTPDGAGWITLMPGFPDGSYGWSQVDERLSSGPRLYIEYVGMGDSDTPSRGYAYGTVERADLVEAQWHALGIRSTYAVTFDISSLVMLELLRRQRERLDRGEEPFTRIAGFVSVNGGLYADGHSHPWTTTPLLKTPLGRLGAWMAGRSQGVFRRMTAILFSPEYGVTNAELEQLFDTITRRDGARFLHEAAGIVDDHRAHAKRWDLRRAHRELGDRVSFHVVGSEQDPFEWRQVVLTRERLGDEVDVRTLPGGHLSTSEQPEALAELIEEWAGAWTRRGIAAA